ncbi:putative Cupin 2 barrel domain-containing protein [Candidatus Sulfopaludibacter sp. SbA4]|nr:putative Cupin 2 barrel domain-containing protein [Candidatus Sulfopaludibacter sp. SbA4]
MVGRAAVHITGTVGRLSGVASWRTLNRLLSFGGLSYPRLRLFKGGVECPEQLYVEAGHTGSPRLLVRELTNALRGGATLAIEAVDELHEPISHLCEALEGVLAVPVQADMFASWGEPALPIMRCNEHDVFIFQVEGRRKWWVHCPIANRTGTSLSSGEFYREATWCGTLVEGDLLYVPRAWHHRDEPEDGASLSVAAKFRHPTGLDLIGRVAHQLSSTKLGSGIPRFAAARELSEYLTLFQRELVETAGRAGALVGALTEMRMVADPRVRFSLPWSAEQVPLPPSGDHRLVPLMRFPDVCIRHCADEDAIEVFVGPAATRFDSAVAPIVERVLRSGGVTMRQLLEAFEPEVPRERILQCVAQLIASGALWLREAIGRR